MLLEICAYNIRSLQIAESCGAGRIELCADPAYGGTTPSYGLLEFALHNMHIPIFPMIRPRGGNFVFSQEEIAVMAADIRKCKDMGFAGIATGLALPNGKIDRENMQRFVSLAYPMEVTCHKVFDGVPDAFAALETLIQAGCRRVLTSGLEKTALEGAAMLAKLQAAGHGKIGVMPGGGIRANNLKEIMTKVGAEEYHSSGILQKGSDFVADAIEVSSMVQLLRA